MSYCRWSTDNFQCDLYCYEDVRGGWTTHIATARFPAREAIGLPYDGQTFNDATLEEFLKRLLHLREVGYQFPDYVMETVREEIGRQRTKAKALSDLAEMDADLI